MVVVAGPAGSGKSRHFPVDSFGSDGFNVDLRAALSSGSSRGIPRSVRFRAQKECEAFVMDHIARRESFAVETTLRSAVAIEQARQALRAGFEVRMIFVCAGHADECVVRVRLRGLSGGHAAPEAQPAAGVVLLRPPNALRMCCGVPRRAQRGSAHRQHQPRVSRRRHQHLLRFPVR
jgi:predicted ABC-type ATPase